MDDPIGKARRTLPGRGAAHHVPAALRIVERSNAELTPDDVRHMQALVHQCDPSLPPDHIRRAHVDGPPVRFYLAWQGDRLVGMQSYSTTTRRTPFARRPLTVLGGHLTYKAPDCAVRGLTERMCFRHLRRALGPAHLLRSWVAFASSPNPRVYVQVRRAMAQVYPHLETGAPPAPAIRRFVSELTGQPVSEHLVDAGDPHLPARVDVTDTFDQLYASRDPELNARYVALGLFERVADRTYLTNRALVVVTVYRPLETALHLLRQRARSIRRRWLK